MTHGENINKIIATHSKGNEFHHDVMLKPQYFRQMDESKNWFSYYARRARFTMPAKPFFRGRVRDTL